MGLVALAWFAGEKRRRASTVVEARFDSEMFCVTHHVANGGCFDEFMAAIEECGGFHLDAAGRAANAEACIKAMAELCKCFAGNPEWFRHVYLRRIDEGLDQDTKPTPEQIDEEIIRGPFRWWTGMRRS